LKNSIVKYFLWVGLVNQRLKMQEGCRVFGLMFNLLKLWGFGGFFGGLVVENYFYVLTIL